MNDLPLVSILMPTYNHELYVEQALDSVLEEDYPNKEIIIIDDGSKDNTQKIIKNWVEKNKNYIPIIFKSRENKGLTKSLNELIDLASGEYIVLLASDDCLKNNGISKRYEYFKNHPDKMGVVSNCIVIDGENNILFEKGIEEFYKRDKSKFETDEKLRKEIIKSLGAPAGPIIMIKKEIYTKIGKYDESLYAEDSDFYLRAIAKNLLGFEDIIVSAYRWHGNNTCSEDPEKRLKLVENNKKVIRKNIHLFTFKERLCLLDQYIVLSEACFVLKSKIIKSSKNNYFSLGLANAVLFAHSIVRFIRKSIIKILT